MCTLIPPADVALDCVPRVNAASVDGQVVQLHAHAHGDHEAGDAIGALERPLERTLEEEPFPGWELQLSWVEENDDPAQANTKGIPFAGRICLQYYSGADKKCVPNWEARADLQERCLIGDGGWKRVQKYDNNALVFAQLSTKYEAPTSST